MCVDRYSLHIDRYQYTWYRYILFILGNILFCLFGNWNIWTDQFDPIMSWVGWMGVLYLKQQFKYQTLVCLSAWLPSSWNAKWCLPSILTQIELGGVWLHLCLDFAHLSLQMLWRWVQAFCSCGFPGLWSHTGRPPGCRVSCLEEKLPV